MSFLSLEDVVNIIYLDTGNSSLMITTICFFWCVLAYNKNIENHILVYTFLTFPYFVTWDVWPFYVQL